MESKDPEYCGYLMAWFCFLFIIGESHFYLSPYFSLHRIIFFRVPQTASNLLLYFDIFVSNSWALLDVVFKHPQQQYNKLKQTTGLKIEFRGKCKCICMWIAEVQFSTSHINPWSPLGVIPDCRVKSSPYEQLCVGRS